MNWVAPEYNTKEHGVGTGLLYTFFFFFFFSSLFYDTASYFASFNLRAMWVCGSVLILPHGTCERKKESFFTQSTYRYLKYRCRTLVSVESCFCNSSTDTHRIAAQCRQRDGWREGEERDIARERG